MPKVLSGFNEDAEGLEWILDVDAKIFEQVSALKLKMSNKFMVNVSDLLRVSGLT